MPFLVEKFRSLEGFTVISIVPSPFYNRLSSWYRKPKLFPSPWGRGEIFRFRGGVVKSIVIAFDPAPDFARKSSFSAKSSPPSRVGIIAFFTIVFQAGIEKPSSFPLFFTIVFQTRSYFPKQNIFTPRGLGWGVNKYGWMAEWLKGSLRSLRSWFVL